MAEHEPPLMDKARVKRKQSREKIIAAQWKADLATVMALPAGRRFMHELIYMRCGFNRVYLGQDSGIYRHEGAREVGYKLAVELQTDHTSDFLRMVTEQLEMQRTKADRDAADDAPADAGTGDDDAS